MARKLLVIMIDGISADQYEKAAHALPHLQMLEQRGFRVQRLHSETIGVSLPGRTSILTGVTADVSGIYGNHIWDQTTGEFRYATPDDVRVPTLAARAKREGLKVANIGLGMVRPEDTDIFMAPWWVTDMIQRGRDPVPEPSPQGWLKAVYHPLEEEFVALCQKANLPSRLANIQTLPAAFQSQAFYGLYADHRFMEWSGLLAAAEDAPNLILTEFLVTDEFLHYTGYDNDMSQWALEQADLALGKIMLRLHQADMINEWNVVVLSDHGHSPITNAIFPQRLLPDVALVCEGSCLLMAVKDKTQLDTITAQLAAYGVEPYPNDCLPPEHREQIAMFVAPDGTAFEDIRPEELGITGTPKLISSHGLRPGAAGDDRFALFAGPNVPMGRVDSAEAAQIAPTLAALLGLNSDSFDSAPIFSTL